MPFHCFAERVTKAAPISCIERKRKTAKTFEEVEQTVKPVTSYTGRQRQFDIFWVKVSEQMQLPFYIVFFS